MARLKNWVRLSLAPGLEGVDFTKVGLFAALDEFSCSRIDSGRRTFEAVHADEDVAQSLGVSTIVPLMFLRQTTYLDDSRVVECSDVWMDSKRIAVAMNLKR